MVATRWQRPVCTMVAALTVALVLAACSGSGDGTPAAGPSEKRKIGVSVPTVQGPFFTAMLYGITDEARKLGYELTIVDAGGYGNVDKQVSQMQNLIAEKVSAILVDPSDPTAIQGPTAQAKSSGITVVGAGDPAPGADGSVSSSHCNIGNAMAAGAKALLPSGGSMAVLAGPAGAFWSTERLKCFKQDIQSAGIRVVAEQTSEPDVAEGLSIASDFLQRHPDVNLLYGADDTVGVGAAKAVEAAGRCGQTKVLFSVLGEQAQALLEKGCVSHVVAQQVVTIGRRAVQLADQLVRGEQPGETEVQVETVAVTKDNVGSVDVGALRAPAGWKPGS